jgi:hypothetical protein
MKAITTILCCIAFAVAGWNLATGKTDRTIYQNTISAATVPVLNPTMLPFDLRLDLEKQNKEVLDTNTIDNGISYRNSPVKADTSSAVSNVVINPVHKRASARARVAKKRRGYSIPAVNPDTIAKNQADVGREEQPTDTIGFPKNSIILIVDGEEVYKR